MVKARDFKFFYTGSPCDDLALGLQTVPCIGSHGHVASLNYRKQEAFEKCWAHSLLRAVLHCHSPGVATAATVAHRLRIDVHDDDDDNDNA